jgi:hypothetical protein
VFFAQGGFLFTPSLPALAFFHGTGGDADDRQGDWGWQAKSCWPFCVSENADNRTVYPLLLYVMSLPPHRLSVASRDQILDDLESWLVRRFICQLTNKNYNRFFVSLLAKLKRAPEWANPRRGVLPAIRRCRAASSIFSAMAAAEPRRAAHRPRPDRRAGPLSSRSASPPPNSRSRYSGRRWASFQTAQPAERTSACSNTVWVAFSCLSGG